MKDTKILAIESSCDETSVAVVVNGRKVLSNIIASQIDTHTKFGGVVPEVAARSHLEVVNPVINKALTDANCTWDDIDAIAVTYAPGLIGSLLIGTLAARTLAVIHSKPIYAIHHVEAHVYANFLTEQGPKTTDESLIEPHYSEETVKSTDMGDFSRTLDMSASGTHGEKCAPRRTYGEEDCEQTGIARLSATTKVIGDRAENVVAEYLETQGHVILARNWKTKICEIDIVSQFGDIIYFTEVKYRKNDDFGGGEAAISNKKLNQMKFAAEYFAHKNINDGSNLQLCAAIVEGEDFTIKDWFEL